MARRRISTRLGLAGGIASILEAMGDLLSFEKSPRRSRRTFPKARDLSRWEDLGDWRKPATWKGPAQ